MDQVIKRKWVYALRSGKYKQGFGALNQDGCFCVFGVLCDLYAQEKNIEWVKLSDNSFSLHNLSQLIPDQVLNWAFDNKYEIIKAERELIEANDSAKMGFLELAFSIEKYL